MTNKQRIEKLEERLKPFEEKIIELKKSQEEKDKLIDFLSKYNKEDVVVVNDVHRAFFVIQSVIKYIYDGKLKEYELGVYCPTYDKSVVVSNNNFSAILQIGKNYYKLDKDKNIMVDITDIYKPKTETKKPSTKTTKTTKKK